MLTLEQSKVGLADKVVQSVIDEFRRASFILDRLTFDNAVSPGTGGSTLTYGYTVLKTPSVASGRAINSEYTAGEAVKEKRTTDLKIFGGAFQVDRVLEASAASSEIALQMQQKTIAARNKFHYDFINGKSTAKGDNTPFNGLKELLKDSVTEYTPDTAVDFSTTEKVKANMDEFILAFDNWLSTLDGKPDALLMNSKMKNIMKFIAKKNGNNLQTEDAFGRKVDTYDGIALIDMGDYFDGTKTVPCVGIGADNTTSIYAVIFGADALHGVSLTGNKIINAYLPDMKAPGAVKKGEVEMVASIALKNSRKAGVFTNIKVLADATPSEK